MTTPSTLFKEAADAVRNRLNVQPTIGLVLGSGMGGLADELTDTTVIAYEDIPHWPRSTVHGHSGRLVVGTLEGQVVLCQQGRAHFYEGYTLQQVTLPIRVMGLLGIKTVILTNAAGGLNKSYKAGDLMVLNDHIYFAGLAGNNPLMGANDDFLGPRFPGMAKTYDRALRHAAISVAADNDVPLHQGVYACVSGPFFETPAEIRFLRMVGADAVGMSTVHEVLVARHMGMNVMAVSGITNECIDVVDGEIDTNHEEVLDMGKIIVPRMSAVLRGVLRSLA